jgi:hypothetical protein
MKEARMCLKKAPLCKARVVRQAHHDIYGAFPEQSVKKMKGNLKQNDFLLRR